ncbi:MAG TPA: hypothetical protein VMZ30_02730 [Pyrinomonadaceae bacterium]|nr:hypothetical protein [Pyrinomonadaceae bacterium]
MLCIPRSPQQKSFQVLVIKPIARTAFLRIIFAAALLLFSSTRGADVAAVSTLKEEKKATLRSGIDLKPGTITIAKTVTAEQKISCRREFTESLAAALEKAKEQRRKLLMEAVETSSPARKRRL